MSTWYYAIDGRQNGPVPSSEIRSLIETGRLDRATDLVWKDGMPDWKAPEAVAEFLAVRPAAAAPGNGPSDVPLPAPAASPIHGSPDAVAANPYAAPQSDVVLAAPAPPGALNRVKPASYGLFLAPLLLGTVLLIAGAVSMEKAPGVDESVGLLMVLAGIAGVAFSAILSLVYLYRAWQVIARCTRLATPGKAVGFLFIPFYNLYWCFVAYWRWAQEWNRVVVAGCSHDARVPRPSEGLFLTYAILNVAGWVVGALGSLAQGILFLVLMKSICDAINWAANTVADPSSSTTEP